jgi:hypothetical protein
MLHSYIAAYSGEPLLEVTEMVEHFSFYIEQTQLKEGIIITKYPIYVARKGLYLIFIRCKTKCG